MTVDISPAMSDAIANIGRRSATAHELGVNGAVLKRLWELGFLKIDLERKGIYPPHYSLSPKGEGAAAILTCVPIPTHHEPPVNRIKLIVCEHYQIPLIEMTSARRSRDVSRPRQVAMYLTRKLTPLSLPSIGRMFSRDHTTVLHAVRQIAIWMDQDDSLNHTVETLSNKVVSKDNNITGDKSAFFVADNELVGA